MQLLSAYFLCLFPDGFLRTDKVPLNEGKVKNLRSENALAAPLALNVVSASTTAASCGSVPKYSAIWPGQCVAGTKMQRCKHAFLPRLWLGTPWTASIAQGIMQAGCAFGALSTICTIAQRKNLMVCTVFSFLFFAFFFFFFGIMGSIIDFFRILHSFNVGGGWKSFAVLFWICI